MEWTDQYSVGIGIIDAQHQKLIDLINQLHDAMKISAGSLVLGKVFAELISYTKYHFGTEEHLMRSRDYPGYLAHKPLHDQFTDRVLALQASQASSASGLVTMDVMQFLRDWLVDHIMQTDKQLGRFLADQGLA